MDERTRLEEERAAGERRRNDGVKILAIGVVLIVMGMVFTLRPNIAPTLGVILIVWGGIMIGSGQGRLYRARAMLDQKKHWD